MSYGAAIGVGVFLLVLAALVFYASLSTYQRISGYAFELSLLVTLASVAAVAGVGALAWWVSTLLFAPGVWRNLTFLAGYSLLQSTLGRGALFLATTLLERRFHL